MSADGTRWPLWPIIGSRLSRVGRTVGHSEHCLHHVPKGCPPILLVAIGLSWDATLSVPGRRYFLPYLTAYRP